MLVYTSSAFVVCVICNYTPCTLHYRLPLQAYVLCAGWWRNRKFRIGFSTIVIVAVDSTTSTWRRKAHCQTAMVQVTDGGPEVAVQRAEGTAEFLRIERARLLNATVHLERSNLELREALREGPDDDLKQAIGVNAAYPPSFGSFRAWHRTHSVICSCTHSQPRPGCAPP